MSEKYFRWLWVFGFNIASMLFLFLIFFEAAKAKEQRLLFLFGDFIFVKAEPAACCKYLIGDIHRTTPFKTKRIFLFAVCMLQDGNIKKNKYQ